MRAHHWEEVWEPEEIDGHGFDPRGGPVRKCGNCNTYQQRIAQTAWMRVTGYLWRPLAGRCYSDE